MALDRSRFVALVVGASLALAACSSSPDGGPSSTVPGTPTSRAAPSSASSVRNYLDAVGALCDDLLGKIMALPGGGDLDVPAASYLAQQPAHAKLLAAFDRRLARVPVPAEAKGKAAVLAAYIRFANRLDAKRLAAARRGAAAYAAEIRSEADVESDPAITARNAAGFAESCDAR